MHRTVLEQNNPPRKLKYKYKHPPKIPVWVGIAKRGATQLVMFEGIMTATRYGDILTASLVQFLRITNPDGHRIMIPNTPVGTFKPFLRITELIGRRASRKPRFEPN